MKIKLFLTTQFLLFLFSFHLKTVAFSSDRLETGELVFNNNCNVCHIRGNNIIIPEKNLRKKSLEANGMNNIEAIVYQVTNGKNGMPAFGGRLKENQIEKVASYVLQEFGKNNEN
jgi:cytochrome c6